MRPPIQTANDVVREDLRKLDAVVEALGIQDSFTEPVDAVRALRDKIESLTRERDDLVAFIAGIGRQAAEMSKSYNDNSDK